MAISPRFSVDVDKAKQLWEAYEKSHDLSNLQNLAVGIDPETGKIHVGETAKAITLRLRLRKEGRHRPLFFRWVADPYYNHKLGRRIQDVRIEQADEPFVIEAL